ncbi:hypothetical protein ACLIBH_06440 [Virgibacillus sp. W0430]|uniref:hypothetical protein n=1 Tax=Virgibacillus sp. W0430 TaxID=3391580 RepID=UPI003F48BE9D
MKKWSNLFIIGLILLFIIGQLFSIPKISYLYLILSSIVIIISLIYSKGLPRLFGTIMVVIGVLVLFYKQAPIEVWIEGVNKNVPLVCLIMLVPILGIPIGLGRYHEDLARLTTRFNNKPHVLYLFITGLFSLLGPITNMGALYIIHSMLDKLNLPNNLLGRVYVRGFTSVHTWAPYFASVFLVVYSLQIPIYQFLPYGFILSAFQISTAFILFRFVEMRHIEIPVTVNGTRKNPKKIYELFAVLLLLTGFIFIFEPLIPLNASVLISVIVLFFAFVWSVYLRVPNQFMDEVKRYRQDILPTRANEISLLLTAGFFGVVLANTEVAKYFNAWWGKLAGTSVFLLIFFTIFIIALLSFLGVHQIVTISAIIATVSYEQLGIHVITMAMMLLSSWAVATTISPITPVITVISSILKENVFKIILRWNLLYALVITCVHTTLIYLIHVFWL